MITLLVSHRNGGGGPYFQLLENCEEVTEQIDNPEDFASILITDHPDTAKCLLERKRGNGLTHCSIELIGFSPTTEKNLCDCVEELFLRENGEMMEVNKDEY